MSIGGRGASYGIASSVDHEQVRRPAFAGARGAPLGCSRAEGPHRRGAANPARNQPELIRTGRDLPFDVRAHRPCEGQGREQSCSTPAPSPREPTSPSDHEVDRATGRLLQEERGPLEEPLGVRHLRRGPSRPALDERALAPLDGVAHRQRVAAHTVELQAVQRVVRGTRVGGQPRHDRRPKPGEARQAGRAVVDHQADIPARWRGPVARCRLTTYAVLIKGSGRPCGRPPVRVVRWTTLEAASMCMTYLDSSPN